MKVFIINENQKGLLFKNGKFERLLNAGKYRFFTNVNVYIVNHDNKLFCPWGSIETLLSHKCIAENTDVCEVLDNQRAIHLVNGRFSELLDCGKYAFWNYIDHHEFIICNTENTEIDESIPRYMVEKFPADMYRKVFVAEYQKVGLFYNGKFQRLLGTGTYYFWRTNVSVETVYIDTRLCNLEITGQEILTRDKVALRVNFVCNYRVTDCIKAITCLDDFTEQLRLRCQLALRSYISGYRLDEILENREEMSRHILDMLKEKEGELYLTVHDAEVKDIILPGEIRDIMNTVLVAEKKAQANVISRREEVASTRSLLNTAKLMEENRTLYKLKELEYIERICENVGNINLASGTDLRTLLGGILGNTANA